MPSKKRSKAGFCRLLSHLCAHFLSVRWSDPRAIKIKKKSHNYAQILLIISIHPQIVHQIVELNL